MTRRPRTRHPCAAALAAAALALATGAPLAGQAESAGGVVAGRVTVAGTDQPVPLALVSVPGTPLRAFAARDGSFRLRLPPGTDGLLVEQLGFEPWQDALPASRRESGRLRVELVPRALDLEGLHVEVLAPRCEGAGFGGAGGDPGAARVMDEARRNAERYRVLLEDHALMARYERVRRYLRGDGSVAGERIDTVSHGSGDRWAYVPGSVLERVDGGGVVFHVPSLQDLAGGAFQSTHCFRFGGVVSAGAQTLLSVVFLPGRGVGGADVRGTLFLDPTTGLLRAGEFEVTDLPDDIHVRELRVDVGYEEIRTLLVVPSVVRTVQRLHDVRFRGEAVATYEAEERLIDVVFSGSDPAFPPGLAPGPAPHPQRR